MIDCQNSLAKYRLTLRVASPDACYGDAFSESGDTHWFCSETIP